MRHIVPDLVKLPCGLSLAQAHEGGGGRSKTPRPARAKGTIISSFRNPASYLHTARSEKGLVDARVGRYGLTVLYLEEDSWIDRATVAMAM